MKVFVALLCVALVASATAAPEPQLKDMINKAKNTVKNVADKGLEKAAKLQFNLQESLALIHELIKKDLNVDGDLYKFVSQKLEQAFDKVSSLNIDKLQKKVDELFGEQQ